MNYVTFINELLKKEVAKHERLVLFGQNINAGSSLGGFAKGLKPGKGGMVINSTNAENTLVGLGFGFMIEGGSSIFLMKQLDFLILGIDHLVNTYNFIRNVYGDKKVGSFTIMPIVVDSGYQGLQSSFNNFGDICSVARIKGLTITNRWDADRIISSELVRPGFRIIGVSQRLFKEEVLDPGSPVFVSKDSTLFQYRKGEDAVIACFNFSLPQGLALRKELEARGLDAALFSVNSPTPIDWEPILKSPGAKKRLVVIDDSKSANLSCDNLLADVSLAVRPRKVVVLKRDLPHNWLHPIADQMTLDYKRIVAKLIK